MKFLSYFTRTSDEPSTNDRSRLIRQNSSVNHEREEDDKSSRTDENDNDDKDESDEFFDSRGPREVMFVESDDCGDVQEGVSSVEVVEVTVVEEQTDAKTKKKKLRKRVRKRVWRVMRTSWKYFRRGMTAYSPGIASMFTWGVNFNQGVRTQRPSATRYF
ncbi:uncharacterized protein [Littorina saxatilis]|uniref:Uncharacterized protein n=1 Tax=Littorina saxatilis TaxID=31220 RepID=A0AAN9BEF7_9CAEN